MTLQLSAEQRAVIEHGAGNLLIEAAAGSGKTTVLARLAHDYARVGARVLALTFSRSGKASLLDKLAQQGTGHHDAIAIHTFDELCLAEAGRQLADEAQLVKKDWVLEHVLPVVVATINQRIAGSEHLQLPADAATLADLLDTFQSIKQARLDILFADEDDAEVITGTLQRPYPVWLAFTEYERQRRHWRQGRHTGFRLLEDACHDLISAHAQQTLLSQPGFGQSCLLIDEFHDTSPLQLAWLAAWGTRLQRVVAVGDRDQVLYAWRGADAQSVFAGFRQAFAPVATRVLTTSFRFDQTLAERVQPLRSRQLGPLSGSGGPTQIHARRQSLSETLASSPLPVGQSALLARDRGQTIAAQLALCEQGTAFYTLDGWPCWRGSEGMLIQALAQLRQPLWQPAQAHQPKQIPHERERHVRLARRLLALPGWNLDDERSRTLAGMVGESASHWPLLQQWLLDLAPPDGARQRAQQQRLQHALSTFCAADDSLPFADALAQFADLARLEDTLRAVAPWGESPESRVHGWRALCAFIRRQRLDATAWLARCEQLNWMHWRASQAPERHLAVGSVFHAKGRQWPHVILTGLGEGAFPLAGATLAEEKRRAYVMATRAQYHLTLHCAPAQAPGAFYRLLAGTATP